MTDKFDHPLFKEDFLTKDHVKELRNTPGGREALVMYILRERIAYGIAKALVDCGMALPSKEVQDKLVSCVWRAACGEKPVWDIMIEMGTAQELLERYGLLCQCEALLSTDDCVGNA